MIGGRGPVNEPETIFWAFCAKLQVDLYYLFYARIVVFLLWNSEFSSLINLLRDLLELDKQFLSSYT
jgi:hypothetical protein